MKLAAGFPALGEHRDAIQRARQAFLRPEWAKQMKRNPEADIASGIEALKARYARHL